MTLLYGVVIVTTDPLDELIPLAPPLTAAGEKVPDDEGAAVRKTVEDVDSKVRLAAKGVPARRDAHAKAHGCVRAEFTVLDGLVDPLRVGVFAKPRTYEAWVRFSNGAGAPQGDAVGDGRGMAIKLMGVERSRSTTQDFVMINSPAFFVRNAADYVAFQQAVPPWRFFVPGLNPFALRAHEFLAARAISVRKIANPLDGRYWSMTPYLYGESACKYSASPVGGPSPFADVSSPDCLRENLARHLSTRSAAFDFMVQLQTRPDEMPIEDPTIEWREDISPFAAVARINIPSQSFDEPAQRTFCENLSFTPWHGLDEHRPLGGINRVRRSVYETVSQVRHELNRAARAEPTVT